MHYQAKLALVTRKFSADFSSITLTQRTSPDPVIFNGVGTISQDNSGTLSLKLFQQSPLEMDKILAYQGKKSGGNVSSAGAFILSAKEYGGADWACNFVRTSESWCLGNDGCTGVISGHIKKLESSRGAQDCFQKSWFEGIIPFELDLPFNLSAQGKRNSYPERMLRFTYNRTTKVEILQCDGYTSVKINNRFELVSEKFIQLFTQALSIATGRTLEYIWRQTHGDYFSGRSIAEYDFKSCSNVLNPPLNLKGSVHLLKFLEAYIDYGLKHDHNYFDYWENLHASWASGLAVAALPLSVYIEGIMKEFYPELMEVDDKVLVDIDLMIDIIENSDRVDKQTKIRMRERLRNGAKGSVMNGLRKLAEKGTIRAGFAQSWHHVRNRAAHGGNFNQEQPLAKIQETVTHILSCLSLFYELLYLKLEFSGYIINYSKIGFPTEFRYADRFSLNRKIRKPPVKKS